MSGVDILSPHYDDGVLSAWHQIEQPNSTVITIFGGDPGSSKRGAWDTFSTKTDAQETIRLRRSENAEALRNSPSTPINLAFLDRQYSLVSKRNISEIASVVEAVSTQSILASIGIGTFLRNHPDHITTRKVALELFTRGHDVSFYADVPYLLPVRKLHNWPASLPVKKIERKLGMPVNIKTIELNDDETQRKEQAFKAFASQTTMVNCLAFGALKSIDAFRFEAIIHPE